MNVETKHNVRILLLGLATLVLSIGLAILFEIPLSSPEGLPLLWTLATVFGGVCVVVSLTNLCLASM